MATVKVVGDVLNRASRLLQDTAKVRYTNEELLLFFNDAQREVVLHRPDANTVNFNFTCSAGSKQTLGSQDLRLVDVVRNVNGRVVTQVDRKLLDDTLPNWHNTTATVDKKIEHFIYESGDPKNFYVYPNALNTHQLEIVTSRAPSDITVSNFSTDTQTIGLDDLYANAILDYLLYRAYQKDSEFAGSVNQAQMHFQSFANGLGIKTRSDAATDPRPNMRPAA
tara:strand:+ start:941 stop:1609 length:669 start_codon:yes stop_codon:yes gene_type:complete